MGRGDRKRNGLCSGGLNCDGYVPLGERKQEPSRGKTSVVEYGVDCTSTIIPILSLTMGLYQ